MQIIDRAPGSSGVHAVIDVRTTSTDLPTGGLNDRWWPKTPDQVRFHPP